MRKCNCEKCKKESMKPVHPDYEVCYYKCNKDCHKKDCCHLVEKTEHLIDAIEYKNKKVIEDLCEAKKDFNDVDLVPIKQELMNVDEDLKAFEGVIGNIILGLERLLVLLRNLDIPELDAAIAQLNAAIPKQAAGEVLVGEALEKAKCIDGMIDHLECEFDKTVECLKENCDNKPMVLMPYEEDCKCKPKKDCGCEY